MCVCCLSVPSALSSSATGYTACQVLLAQPHAEEDGIQGKVQPTHHSHCLWSPHRAGCVLVCIAFRSAGKQEGASQNPLSNHRPHPTHHTPNDKQEHAHAYPAFLCRPAPARAPAKSKHDAGSDFRDPGAGSQCLHGAVTAPCCRLQLRRGALANAQRQGIPSHHTHAQIEVRACMMQGRHNGGRALHIHCPSLPPVCRAACTCSSAGATRRRRRRAGRAARASRPASLTPCEGQRGLGWEAD